MEQLLHTHTHTHKAIEEPIDVSSRDTGVTETSPPTWQRAIWRDISEGPVCILAHPVVKEIKQNKPKKNKKNLSSLKNI